MNYALATFQLLTSSSLPIHWLFASYSLAIRYLLISYSLAIHKLSNRLKRHDDKWKDGRRHGGMTTRHDTDCLAFSHAPKGPFHLAACRRNSREVHKPQLRSLPLCLSLSLTHLSSC